MSTERMREIHRLRQMISEYESYVRINQSVLEHSERMIKILKGELEVLKHENELKTRDRFS